MRTSRLIFYAFLGTVAGLFYVFQQTEIVKLGYKITSTEKILQTALDRKTSLEYTLSSLESPSHLDKTLFLQDNRFEIAQRYKLVKVHRPAAPGIVSRVAQARPKRNMFNRFAFQSLFASKQAEAKTIR
jgi:hypothetical protein